MIIIEDYYNLFITFIIVIKIIYYTTYVYHFMCKIFNIGPNLINNYYLLNTLSIVFNTSIALLLLYLFNPYYKVTQITNYTRELLFLYAIILLIGNLQFINENNLVKIIKKLLNLN